MDIKIVGTRHSTSQKGTWQEPGDFVTKVKQIDRQSDLISMSNLPVRLTSQSDLCVHHFNLTFLYFQS